MKIPSVMRKHAFRSVQDVCVIVVVRVQVVMFPILNGRCCNGNRKCKRLCENVW